MKVFLSRLWSRPLPHGLISLRYLWCSNGGKIAAHRSIWLHSEPAWPRGLWLAVEILLWVKWVGFTAWPAIWRAWRKQAGQVAGIHHISAVKQLCLLVRLAIGAVIPPADIYRFKLYLKPAGRWDYVYDHEAKAFHHWRNRGLGNHPHEAHLLTDKLAQMRELSARDVPMAPVIACVPQGASADISQWLTSADAVFCKSRSGSRGLAALAAWRQGAGIAGKAFNGAALDDAAAVTAAWRRLVKRDDALVQPLLRNHPALAALGAENEAVTLRYISHRPGMSAACLCASLEIPLGGGDYVILAVDAASGRIGALPDHIVLTKAAAEKQQQILAALADEAVVPNWPELVAASALAHQQFPNCWAIAWDWVLTPEGPRLLEGNGGWGTSLPQLLTLGFLHNYPD